MSGTEGGAGGDGPVLAMLGRVFDALRGIQEEQRRQSKRMDQLTAAVVSLSDQVQRLDRRVGEVDRHVDEVSRRVGEVDRRMGELKDDLEVMIRAELMGQNAMLRAELGSRFDALEDRVTLLEGGNPWRPEGQPA